MSKKLIKKQALDEFGSLFIKTLQEQLQNNRPFAKVASGNLIKSFKWELKEEKGNDVFVVTAAPYMDFVDKGVNGTQRNWNSPYSYRQKKPPLSVIKNWMRLKGIPEEAAFPIQNKIFRFGIKPTNFINKSIREIQYRSQWATRFEGDVADSIIEMAKKTFGYK